MRIAIVAQSSVTAKHEYHFKCYKPYVQLLHAVYMQFDTLHLPMFFMSLEHLLILRTNSRSTSLRLENFSKRGLGKNQRKQCENPFSEFEGISISPLATPGWLKPPTVNWVEDIAKLASPLTIM